MLRIHRPLILRLARLGIGALAATPLDSALANTTACAPIAFGAAHESPDEAAAHALHALLDERHGYESGGYLIELNGVFYASRPVTQRARSSVSYCIVLPRGARLAGIYHTHVASPTLSARDRSNAERAGVPSYIGIIRDRSLMVYDARTRAMRRLDDRSRGTLLSAHSAQNREASAEGSEAPHPLREKLAALKQYVMALLERVSDRR